MILVLFSSQEIDLDLIWRIKTSLVIFIIKRSKYRSSFSLSKAKIEFWPIEGILVISRSTELQIGWFLMHWKANSKGYNFILYTKARLSSIIKKISVEIEQKIEQGWNLFRIKQTYKRQYVGYNMWPKVAFLRLRIYYFQLKRVPQLVFCSHNFSVQFQQAISAISDQKECEKLENQPLRVSRK